jgi:hypothetical protein
VSNLHPEILAVIQAHFPSATGIRVTLTLPDTIGIGAKYLESLDLSEEDQAIVNAHHIRKQHGQYVMRDTPELRRVIRWPERGAGE